MAMSPAVSPRILSSGWGKMVVEKIGAGKDFKLWPGGGRVWDWSEHGTSHSRGVQRGDVLELIENGSRVVVLTTGRFNRLNVSETVLDLLHLRGIRVKVAGTREGIQLYNDYASQGEAVGGLFHSTC